MRKVVSIAVVCFMIITVFSGCAILQKLGLQESDNDELRPVSSIAIGEDEAKKLSDNTQIRLYFANAENKKLKLEIRYIPMSEAKKSVSNLANVIVTELINGPSKDSGLKATVPKEAKLASKVKVDTETATATVDFNNDFISKHPGGKDAERLTIYSIVNSLTELKEIQKVRFTINGKKTKEFKGNFQFDVPFPRTESLISREIATPSSVTTTDAKDIKKDGTEKDTKKTDEKKKDDKKDGTKTGDSEEMLEDDASGAFGDEDVIEQLDGEPLE
ncbi:MAG: GerMN domain-containing protein [Clostridia bacterium]|nr:GerMN domain-containing protein [Clostridia bacterium]